MTEQNTQAEAPAAVEVYRQGDAALDYSSSGLLERQAYAWGMAEASALLPSSVSAGTRTQMEIAGRFMYLAEVGAQLGIHPLAAIHGIHVIERRPSISAGLMSALVRKAGHKLRVQTGGSYSAGDLWVEATLIRGDDPDYPFAVRWTIEDAKTAGLAGKGNWAKYPRAMLKARAISEVCREGAEDALAGIRYTPEELGAEVDESGEPVNLGHVKSAPAAPADPAAAQPAPAARPAASAEPAREAPPAPAPAASAPPAPPAPPEPEVIAAPATSFIDASTIDPSTIPPAVVTLVAQATKAASEGDLTQLGALFSEAQSKRLLNAPAATYNEGEPAPRLVLVEGWAITVDGHLRALAEALRGDAV